MARINIEDRWGSLPPELKQQLLDGKVREFSPEYKTAIERYLKRLSTPKKK